MKLCMGLEDRFFVWNLVLCDEFNHNRTLFPRRMIGAICTTISLISLCLKILVLTS